MKIAKFYICDISLFLLSIIFIKLYDAYFYKYIGFWSESFAYILAVSSASVVVGATIAFIIQKLCKLNIPLYKSLVYTFLIISVVSGLLGVGLIAYAYFILVSSWDALGYAVLGIISICVSGTLLAVLAIYYIIKRIIKYKFDYKSRVEKSNEDNIK